MISRNFFVNWYKVHGRDFPWRRNDVSPFAMLVTEMLLRQTQARAVSKLWSKLIQKYTDARALAQANEEDLLDQLGVLGLGEQRSSALIAAATWLVENHHGQVPDTKEELLKIPHIGKYAAHAVLCFAFGYKIEVVDTNILRFYARYYGLDVKPDIRRNPEVWKIAKLSLPKKRKEIQQHNYGLLDFTAEICRSKMPRCNDCPLVSSCKWGMLQLSLSKKHANSG